MRYLVISDIHSNLVALEAVLADAGEYDKVWCLGDMVGYGPRPNECIERLCQLNHVCVAGNHDWAAIDKLDIGDFNVDAKQACLWTRETLSPENWEYLENLPERLEFPELDFTLVHGSPRHPIWEYILSPFIAKENFDHFNTQFCLVGHTHIPAIFRSYTRSPVELTNPLHLDELGEERLIINPGSVGQPRDGDPRASYAIFDTEDLTLEIHRIPYPIEVTQEEMKKVNLPPRLIVRLSYGW